MERRLDTFSKEGYDKGRSTLVQALWFACMNLFFSPWWVPARMRVTLLRLFGAEIGVGVLIRHRVRVLWPWKLTIGDQSWIGEGAWLLNLEPIHVGSHVVVSQEAFLCTGGHDARVPSFDYANAPITVSDGAWIGARGMVLPGVTIGSNAVLGAGAIASRSVPDGRRVLARMQVSDSSHGPLA